MPSNNTLYHRKLEIINSDQIKSEFIFIYSGIMPSNISNHIQSTVEESRKLLRNYIVANCSSSLMEEFVFWIYLFLKCGIVSECQVRVGSGVRGVMDRSCDTSTMWQSAPQDTSSPVLALLCASCSSAGTYLQDWSPTTKNVTRTCPGGGTALHCQLWQKYNFILESVLRAGTRDSAKWGAAAAERWLRGSESLL